MAQVIGFVLTIVLFFGKSDPASISNVYETEHACRASEALVLNTAMADAKIAGFVVTDDCMIAREANKS